MLARDWTPSAAASEWSQPLTKGPASTDAERRGSLAAGGSPAQAQRRRLPSLGALARWIGRRRGQGRGERLRSATRAPLDRPGFYGDSFVLPDGSWFHGRRDSA